MPALWSDGTLTQSFGGSPRTGLLPPVVERQSYHSFCGPILLMLRRLLFPVCSWPMLMARNATSPHSELGQYHPRWRGGSSSVLLAALLGPSVPVTCSLAVCLCTVSCPWRGSRVAPHLVVCGTLVRRRDIWAFLVALVPVVATPCRVLCTLPGRDIRVLALAALGSALRQVLLCP